MTRATIAAFLTIGIAPTAMAFADHVRTAARYFPLGVTPARIVSADLNADNRDDLIVLAEWPVRYQILLSEPDGSWDAHPEVEIGGNAVKSVRVADVNADGRDDLLVLPSSSPTLHVLLNSGAGSLTPAAASPVFSDNSLQTFNTGDLNNDSHPDLVVGRQQEVSVLYNSGTGTFSASGAPVAITPNTLDDIVIGDFRGTGQNEIAIIAGNTAYFAHHDNSGFVQSAAVSLTLPGYRGIAADVTGDGASELVTLGSTRAAAIVTRFDTLLQQYVSAVPPGILPTYTAVDAAFGDISGNGLPDIVPAGDSSAIARVLYANVNFNPPVREVGPALGTFYNFDSVTIADVDADGLKDIVYATSYLPGFTVFKQDDAGGFATSGIHEITGSTAFDTIYLREENGRPVYFEGVTSSNQNGRLFTVDPDPQGFRLSVTDLPSVPGAQHSFWTAGDINGDDIVDLVRAATNSDRINWQIGQADGSFGPVFTRTVSNNSPVSSVAIADFNGDSINDITAVTSDGQVHIGLGAPSGFVSQLVSTPTVSAFRTATLRALDMDDDGHTDLTFAADNHGIIVCYGNGDGTFDAATTISTINFQTTTNVERLDAADLDGDGYADLVVANANTSVLHISTGPRTYEPYTVVSDGSDVTRVRFVDFDGDGLLDIATTSRGRTEFVTRTGRGLLESRSIIRHTQFMPFCDYRDLDGDGLADFLYSSSLGVSLMFNRSLEPCVADHFSDGRFDLFDFAQFIRNFNERVPIADIDRDGVFTFFDVARFIELFQLGCP